MNSEEINQIIKIRDLDIPKELLYFIVGIALLLFGYKLKRLAFFIIWFILGFSITMWLMPTINSAVPQIANDQLYQLLIPIGGGVIIAMLGFTIEKLCVAGAAFVLTMLITVQYFGTEWLTLIIGGIIGAVLGAFAVKMIKPATVVVTAVTGAYALTLALFAFFPQIDFTVLYWPILIGLGVIGAVFQFKTNKGVS